MEQELISKDFSTRFTECLSAMQMYGSVYGFRAILSVSKKTDNIRLSVYSDDGFNIPKPVGFDGEIDLVLTGDRCLCITLEF